MERWNSPGREMDRPVAGGAPSLHIFKGLGNDRQEFSGDLH